MKKILWGLISVACLGMFIVYNSKVEEVQGYNVFPSEGFQYTQTSQSSGVPYMLYMTNGAHTGGTASTEWPQIYFNLSSAVTRNAGNLSGYDATMLISGKRSAFTATSSIKFAGAIDVQNSPNNGDFALTEHSYAFGNRADTNNASSTHGYFVSVPGIENSIGNVDERSGIHFNDDENISLGNTTSNITNIYGVDFSGPTLYSTTNVRTITGNLAALYVKQPFQLGSNVSLSAGQSYSLLIDSGTSRFDGAVAFANPSNPSQNLAVNHDGTKASLTTTAGSSLVLTEAGNMGVNTSTPRSAFHVDGSTTGTTTAWIGNLDGAIGQICVGDQDRSGGTCFYGNNGVITAFSTSTY